MTESNIYNINNISKSFSDGADNKKRSVIKDINISIEKGTSIAITGPSGSGKSTFLNILGSLEKPDKGEVIYNNHNIYHFNENQLNSYRNQEIGFVFQQCHLLPQLTVEENILLPFLAFNNRVSDDLIKRSFFLMEAINIKHLADKKTSYLSGGEKTRVAIARSLINNPKVLLADEPTGSLDNKTSLDVLSLINTLKGQEKFTLILVTHSKIVADYADEIYLLNNSKLNKIK